MPSSDDGAPQSPGGGDGGSGSKGDEDVTLLRRSSRTLRGGRTLDGCRGTCRGPLVDLGLTGLAEFNQAIKDLADLMVNPLELDPLLVNGSFNGHPQKAIEKVDRLWELRLCIEILRDTLDGYDLSGAQDALSTAPEAMATVEDTLHRILDIAARAREGGEEDEFLEIIEQIREQESTDGHVSLCLMRSGLAISGLLEMALGELSDWHSRPSEAEMVVWKRWDRTYEGIVERAVGGNTPDEKDVVERQPTIASECCGSSSLAKDGSSGIAERADAPVQRCFAFFLEH
eukprot:TRINITY_DN27474_c0_g2_i1.p1 TRINITY_DN27474_c0_g2~~TRINITY_DN27474_c0_g2_i1.p1  ORF type:complete len:287 (-),score=53.36 TRINITY_DN27474_c0_g2_i1:57-917(-)